MDNVYLDNAATTQLRKSVLDKMQAVLAETYGNPSSVHSFGRSAKTGVEKARKTIAKYLNAKPSEILFTSGGTEANNMILRGAVRDLNVKTIITSLIEHHAVLHTVQALEKEYAVAVKYVALDAKGNPDLIHLKQLLEEASSKTLVSLMHVNNEIGNTTNLEELGVLCSTYGALLHSDTVQSVGHYRWDLSKSPVDFLTASAHKFHGPKGVGFAYIRKNPGLKPLLLGGAQERGFRAGTESVHNIVGFEEAFVQAYDNLDKEAAYVKGLKQYFIGALQKQIPGVRFNGHSADMEKSSYAIVNVCLPIDAKKAVMLLFHLDIKGIACSKGSACQSGSSLESHVLTEVCSEEDLKKPSLRFSFSIFNTQKELDYTLSVLKDFIEN